jgi:hypothetical protein
MLRFTVIFAWKSATRKLKFRNQSLEAVMEVFNCTKEAAISYFENGVWGCGDSADQICLLLAGNTLSSNSSGGADVEDDTAMNRMYKNIIRVGGPILARIDVKSDEAGHAYVFVSRGGGNPLEGYIYQTNVGIPCREYDICEWVRDEKSSETVYLPGHLAEVQSHLVGFFGGEKIPWDRTPAKVYAENYLRSGKEVPPKVKKKMERTVDLPQPRQFWYDLVKGGSLQAFVGASLYKVPDAAAPFFAYVFVVRSTVHLTGRKVTSPRSVGAVLDHPFEAILSIDPLISWQH